MEMRSSLAKLRRDHDMIGCRLSHSVQTSKPLFWDLCRRGRRGALPSGRRQIKKRGFICKNDKPRKALLLWLSRNQLYRTCTTPQLPQIICVIFFKETSHNSQHFLPSLGCSPLVPSNIAGHDLFLPLPSRKRPPLIRNSAQ